MQLGLRAALLLLAGCAAIVALAAAVEYRGRAGSPEATVRRYFRALEEGDVERALEAIAPANRHRWVDFVANGRFNEYRIVGIAVRQTSVLERLRGSPPGPQDATTFLDITTWTDGVRWQAAPRVPLEQHDGRWYLSYPPLAAGP